MSGDDILDFADHFGPVVTTPVEPEERQLHLVTFSLGREQYAVPIDLVREVVRVTDITRVPHAPAHIRGVMNLRGRILPVMDLRTRLGLEAGETTHRSRVVVVEIERRVLGLLVDAVAQVTRLGEGRVTTPPEEVRAAGQGAITGVAHLGERLLVLLDVARVLRNETENPSTLVDP